MREIAVKTPVCDICGVEVRAESLFCYNCGGSVSEPVSAAGGLETAVEEADVSANGKVPGTKFDPAARRAERVKQRTVRASNRQPVEIVWEPRTGVGWPFILGSTALLLIALALFFTAYYIR